MLVTALDLATKTGVAHGNSEGDAKPLITHWDLGGRHIDLIPGELCYRLRCLWRDFGIPDYLAIEQTLDPSAQKHGRTVRSQERLHGAALGAAGFYRIRKVHEIYPAPVRVHFIGMASAGGRDETKAAVFRQARMLGYDVKTTDESDAVALFDFVVHAVLRVREKELRMFHT